MSEEQLILKLLDNKFEVDILDKKIFLEIISLDQIEIDLMSIVMDLKYRFNYEFSYKY